MNHRSLVFTTFFIVLLLSPIVFGASAVKAQRAKPVGQSEWEKTVQAAKREGQVRVYSGSWGEALRARPFQKNILESSL